MLSAPALDYISRDGSRGAARLHRARARARGRRLVRPRRPRGSLAARRGPPGDLPIRGRAGVPAGGGQPQRPGAGRGDGDVPLGGRPGGLPRAGRRGAADRRGRGAAAPAVGLRALPAGDEARHRRGRFGPERRARRRRPRPFDRPRLGRLHRRRGRGAPRCERRARYERARGGVRTIPQEARAHAVSRGLAPGMTNHARAFAERPEVYAAWQQLNGAIKDGMDLRRYELATLAAARRLRSSYCCLAHGTVLQERFGEPVLEIARDHRNAGLSDVDVAVMDLAERVVDDATSIADADLERLRQLGLSETD